MEKVISSEFINKTFSFPFDEVNFSNFVHNIFDNIKLNDSTNWIGNSNVPLDLKSYVNRYKVLGSYKDTDNGLIIISMIELKNKNIVEKSRNIQRDFSKWLLNKFNADACLVSFFANDSDDWRFSLVTINYTREITKLGKLIATENISPLKRYSYLVGKNEPNHTAQSQLSPLLIDENKNPTIQNLIKAFTIEKVTKEFFNDYKKLTYELAGELNNVQSDSKILNEFKNKRIDELSFAKKIMSQLIFVFFLQKKGLLAFQKKNFENLTGEKKFLRKLFDKNKNFFNNVLEPLFYEGFSRTHNNNFYEPLKCYLPNISVSLFDPINNYNWKKTKIMINNSVFEKIFAVFERYNFTVSEEQPLDIEVAVDPEMLGKVFESLIDENVRKSTGAFYTPRIIVHNMCIETIAKYLNNNQKKIKLGKILEITKTLSSDFFDKKKIKNVDTSESKILYDIIKKVRIIDPAVGSGAFLVENLNIITKIVYNLENILDLNPDLFQIRKDIIKNNLYGSDIDVSAIEIAKLRLWLALIVNEEKIRNIEDLPNLDFKIVKLNSLIVNKPDLLNYDFLQNLSKLYKRYFDLKRLTLRVKMKNEIDEFKRNNSIKHDIYSEFFDIFDSDKNGFDIIIANPPYVGEKGNKEIFSELKKSEIYNFFKSKSDFFYYFIHLGLIISNQNASLSFITTNYFFTASGASKLRVHIKEESNPYKIINFKELKIFESALGQSNAITFLDKTKSQDNCEVITAIEKGTASNKDLENIFNKDINYSSINNLLIKNVFDKDDDLKMNSILSIENYDSYSSIINKLMKIQYNLSVFCNINSGADVVPSKLTKKHVSKFTYFNQKDAGNGIFILNKEEKDKLKFNDNEKLIIKKLIKSSDVKKFKINFNNKYLIYTRYSDNINKLPNIKKHLEKYKVILDDQIKRYEENMPWFALHRPGSHIIFESNEKIVAPYRSKSNTFGYTNKKFYSSRDNYFISLKNSFKNQIELKYILGILNSELILFWLLKKGKRKGSMLELYPQPLEIIPIKNTTNKIRINVIDIVNKLINNNEDRNYLNKLNEFIYSIYQIDEKEKLIIKNTINNNQ